jgi:GAF domain-containing protein
MADFPDGFAAIVIALNSSMVHEESLHDTLQRVAFIACESQIGTDHAGVTLQRPTGPTTAAYHGDCALPLDRAQYAADDGPCLTAYRNGETVAVGSIADEADRWPYFAKTAAERGIVSSLSLPLALRTEIVGALNLYASEPLTFDERRMHLASLFAQQVALAVTNAEMYFKTYTLTQNLMIALENRERIGQAKGILATRLYLTMDDAFELLRRTSQRLNIKLRDVADYVATTGELPSGSE